MYHYLTIEGQSLALYISLEVLSSPFLVTSRLLKPQRYKQCHLKHKHRARQAFLLSTTNNSAFSHKLHLIFQLLD